MEKVYLRALMGLLIIVTLGVFLPPLRNILFRSRQIPDLYQKMIFQNEAQKILFGKKMNINLATAYDLQTISGIGPALSQRIISFRNEHGPFRNKKDLLKVKGIGSHMLQKIMLHISY